MLDASNVSTKILILVSYYYTMEYLIVIDQSRHSKVWYSQKTTAQTNNTCNPDVANHFDSLILHKI